MAAHPPQGNKKLQGLQDIKDAGTEPGSFIVRTVQTNRVAAGKRVDLGSAGTLSGADQKTDRRIEYLPLLLIQSRMMDP